VKKSEQIDLTINPSYTRRDLQL